MNKKNIVLKIFSIVLCFCCSSVFLLACGDGGNKNQYDSLYVITMFGNSDLHASVYTEINDEFSAKYGTKVIDNSAESGPTWMSNVKRAFLAEAFTPDVLFFFNGKSADSIREHLVPLETILAYDSDYGKDISISVDDDSCLPIKGISEGIIYNEDYYSLEDFVDYETMKNKIIENSTGKGMVSAGYDIPHYWLNHLLALKLGADEFESFDGTKTFFDNEQGRKEKWIEAFEFATIELLEMNICTDINKSESKESKSFFDTSITEQARGLLLDGSWTAGNIETSGYKLNITGFPPMNPNDESFVLSGFTSGWYITKKAWNNETIRRKAVDFVKMHSSAEAVERYCLAAGGVPATGKDISTASASVNKFTSLIDTRTILTPLDDRLSSNAKEVLYDYDAQKDNNCYWKILTSASLFNLPQLKTEITELFNSICDALE